MASLLYPRSYKTIFPQKPTQPNHLCASVGGSSPPETSVNSVNSVGEPYAAKPSVCICAICGRIIKWVAWVWQGCHTLLSVFCGQYISARLVQQRLLHPLNFLWVPLSMLKSKCFDHYFHFKLRFYILG